MRDLVPLESHDRVNPLYRSRLSMAMRELEDWLAAEGMGVKPSTLFLAPLLADRALRELGLR
eukprot:1762811-Heterocapsa_arctica.AAC.1